MDELRRVLTWIVTLGTLNIAAWAFGAPQAVGATYSPEPLAIVYNVTRVKILESNNVSIRTGSVYDNITYFESLLDFPQPGFNYEFIDTGLGTADPLYPNYQKGHQGSWFQLIPAYFSAEDRHIDHFTSLPTPEGCFVDSAYLLRGLNTFPKTLYQKERDEGYTMIVIRLEYYTAMKANAECGRHRTNPPDPSFDPMAYLKSHLKAQTFADFDPGTLARFEAKISAIREPVQIMSRTKWPRFNLDNLNHNSLWYYPDGFVQDYGIDTPRAQPGLQYLNLPRHLVISPSDAFRDAYGLSSLLPAEDFAKVLNFVSGHPTADFNPVTEPGHDTLNLADVTSKNYYTSGLNIESIQNAYGDVSDPSHFRLVGITLKPQETEDDISYSGERVIPEVRFVYQMMNPRTGRTTEQFYLHLKFDAIDRSASDAVRAQQQVYFLNRIDQLTQAKESGDSNYDQLLADFVEEFTRARPMMAISFSSSMTGTWVFGALSRAYNTDRNLEAVRIVRDGVDVGYYSSSFDNDVFNETIAASTGAQKALLQSHMDDITVAYYRDPKRMDTTAIRFDRVTCAQCHQTAGRDGVHMSFNDGLDSRYKEAIRGTEYLYHEADRQLQVGQFAGH